MKKIAVLTGAGISTSAGIPDFRGPEGVWTKHPDQMQVYDMDAFMKDKEAREFSWRWQKESPVWNAKCTKAHFALAELEKAGGLGILATQNFDGLHEKAGSRNVVDLHGTILTSHCMKCGKKYDTKEIMKNLDEEPDPRCEK
ncbi:MAG: Sir2 family NAD-dependent protein deacetylase, partial [Aeriscardovia sp.]|nr:Sir2 family NAD-dependent protein deacetylase [Aeriscardovia sp.]